MPVALIVEDERDVLLLFQEALTMGGFETLIASSAGQAIRLLEAHTPHLALVDLNMPGRPGTDVLEYIRNTPRLAGVKRIVVTANALAETRAEELGTDLFLIKPVSVKELLTLAQRLTS